MSRSMITTVVFAAAIAVAVPIAANSQNAPQNQPNPPPAAQQAQPPSEHGGGPAGGMPSPGRTEMGQMGQGMMGQGMMGQGMGSMHEMMERMHEAMEHRGRMRSPAQRCRDRLARRAAGVAYVVTELGLDPQQQQIWNRVNGALQQGLQREQQLCNALEPNPQRGPLNLLGMINLREQVLEAQLQTLHQAQPPLQQLYQTLNPRQQAIVNNAFQHRRGHDRGHEHDDDND